MCQVDLFGPVTVMVPGFERETRNRRVLEANCYVMVAVCPATRLVNMQTLESCKAAGWLDAFTRLSCEVGHPKHVFCDQDSAGMSAFNMAETELRDLKLELFTEKRINFSVCAVTGHDRHGHVERVIRSVQESFEDSGLGKTILHATGLQTLCKLIENQYNNLPLGYHYDRDCDNSPLLRILTPNMLRVGKVNKRAMDGPIRMPKSRLELLARVNETYDSWYKIWAETMVPKLLFKPKWFKTEKELKVGDLVYFPRADNKLDKKWIMGVVDSVERGRDGLIRMVDIRYKNASQSVFQLTNRTVRKVVKLWGIEDTHLNEDLAEMGRRFQAALKVMEDIESEDRDDYDEVPLVTGDVPLGGADGPGIVDELGPEDDEEEQQGAGAGEAAAGTGDGDTGVVDEPGLEDYEQQQVPGAGGVDTGDLLPRVDDGQLGGSEPRQQPGAEGDGPPVGSDGGPAANTRSKRCAKCCCLSHHSYSLHMRKCQIGEVPVIACQLDVNQVLDLFSSVEYQDSAKGVKVNTIEGVLMAVGEDISL